MNILHTVQAGDCQGSWPNVSADHWAEFSQEDLLRFKLFLGFLKQILGQLGHVGMEDSDPEWFFTLSPFIDQGDQPLQGSFLSPDLIGRLDHTIGDLEDGLDVEH